jgi:hypothetical protein
MSDHNDRLIDSLMEENRKYEKFVELLKEMHLYESNDYGIHYKVVNVDRLLEEVGIGND